MDGGGGGIHVPSNCITQSITILELSKIKTKNVNDKKCIIHLKNKISKSNQKDFKHANRNYFIIFVVYQSNSSELFCFTLLHRTHIYFHT